VSRRPRRPGHDDSELLRALRSLADDYEPDVTAIELQVIGRARGGPPAGRARRRPPVAVRPLRAVLLPAATVLILTGTTVLATSGDAPDQSPDGGSALPIATAVATAVPSPAPASASPTASRPPTRSTPVTPSSPAPGRVKVRPLPPTGAGTAVDLTRTAGLDWLVVGARADGKQVRAKATVASPVVTVEQPGSATAGPGPFSTSWTAGFPEQSHHNATGWLGTDGAAGLTLTVAASRKPRTVLLYAGIQDLRGTLSIGGRASTPKRTPLGVASAARAFVITVFLAPATDPVVIRLSGSPQGPTPRVYLAAVTATSSS
jgi:hypothetical protein